MQGKLYYVLMNSGFIRHDPPFFSLFRFIDGMSFLFADLFERDIKFCCGN